MLPNVQSTLPLAEVAENFWFHVGWKEKPYGGGSALQNFSYFKAGGKKKGEKKGTPKTQN